MKKKIKNRNLKEKKRGGKFKSIKKLNLERTKKRKINPPKKEDEFKKLNFQNVPK